MMLFVAHRNAGISIREHLRDPENAFAILGSRQVGGLFEAMIAVDYTPYSSTRKFLILAAG
jgi:hypothetical protein